MTLNSVLEINISVIKPKTINISKGQLKQKKYSNWMKKIKNYENEKSLSFCQP